MANEKFTELPVADTPLAGTEIACIVQDGVSKQTPVSNIGGSSYLVYKAYLSQTGTNNPTVVRVLQNTIGNIVWTRSSLGQYLGTLSGAFAGSNNVVIPPYGGADGASMVLLPAGGVTGSTPADYFVTVTRTTNDAVLLAFYDSTFNSVEWSTVQNDADFFIEIQVYP